MSSLWLNREFDGVEADSEVVGKHLDELLDPLSLPVSKPLASR